MHRGKFKMFDTQKGFGFIAAPEFPDNIFAQTKSIWLPPSEFPAAGDECTFDVGEDRLGRPVANDVRITRDERPYVQRPGERRVYVTTVMHAEPGPVEFGEPSALARDRERHRDFRARREMRARAERIFTIHGADEV
jgi:cold shock CspA family protein